MNKPGVAAATESLGERIQAAVPEARVVKSLNTMTASVMVEPSRVQGDHDVFVCGNDDAAKGEMSELLRSFGWEPERIVDVGDITGARGAEMYVVLWIQLYGALGTGQFNIHVAR